ncbi:MAG: PD40 domain-containing protein, partial [Lewinella sp.]|nr:PD40 domain-containing protein [Lewinella sp.]
MNCPRWLLFAALLLPVFLFAQGYAPMPGTLAARHFQAAEAAMLDKDFGQAIRLFERALSAQPTLVAAHKMIGECYALQGNYRLAADHYLKTLEADSLFSRKLYYELGDSYYKMGRPELALYYFARFQELQELPHDVFGLHGVAEAADELILLNRLPGNLRACTISMDSIKFINITEIHNLGPQVNSRYDDYFPFLTNNQTDLYFTRQREDGDEDLYFSEYRQGAWRSGERIRGFNTDQPEGMSTLVRDGRRLFFTACLREGVGGPCDIWEALVSGKEITELQSLGGPVNTGAWESQAAISCDGSRLYFASNRAGGLGGTDLWMSERLPNGLWSSPQNLGAPINTPDDEEAPFISNDGKTLYFSSTGHLGLGEQDIFMCWWDERLQ